MKDLEEVERRAGRAYGELAEPAAAERWEAGGLAAP